jgi:hypothetical protein
MFVWIPSAFGSSWYNNNYYGRFFWLDWWSPEAMASTAGAALCLWLVVLALLFTSPSKAFSLSTNKSKDNKQRRIFLHTTDTGRTRDSLKSDKDDSGDDDARNRINPLQWWQNLVVLPLYSLLPLNAQVESEDQAEDPDDDNDDENDWLLWDSNHSSSSSDNDDSYDSSRRTVPDVTHFCFLVHGHRGYSRDLSYLQAVMRKLATVEKKKRFYKWRNEQQQPVVPGDRTDQSSDPNHTATEFAAAAASISSRATSDDLLVHDLVVHSSCCNEKKTDDGVIHGGVRLTEEIVQVIAAEMDKRRRRIPDDNNNTTNYDDAGLQNITLSLLGNSLGGIYARYAIAELVNRGHFVVQSSGNATSTTTSYILQGRYRVQFNIFCTTATPHLGVAGHTFLPIPRSAEIRLAHAMGDTGRDLFRLNDLLRRMATAPEFIQPLRAFRKRIAYANAYGTDFPVPMQTAAFLSNASNYPHHFEEQIIEQLEENENHTEYNGNRLVGDGNNNSSGLVIATLHTPPQPHASGAGDHSERRDDEEEDEDDELLQMSNSLDSLGWKKVFVDVRKQIPRISLPTSLLRRSSFTSNNNADIGANSERVEKDGGDKGSSSHNSSSERRLEAIHILKNKGVASSSDVAAALTTPLFEDQFHWPVGHNMIVAFSRSRFSAYLNKAGRPVVDALASELVESIFSWSPVVEVSGSRDGSSIKKNDDM